MLLKLPFNVLFQGVVSGVFIIQGNAVPGNDHVPGNFLEDGKLLWSLLSLVLGLIMRNCEDY